jgi:hypothetical protein
MRFRLRDCNGPERERERERAVEYKVRVWYRVSLRVGVGG